MSRKNPSTQIDSATATALYQTEKAKRAPKAKATKATPAPEATPDAPKAEKAQQKGGETILRTGRMSARDLPCLCGCGNPTHTKDARFLSGHDAKLRKVILLQGAEATPEIIRPFFARGEEIAGLLISEDGGVTDTKPQASR